MTHLKAHPRSTAVESVRPQARVLDRVSAYVSLTKPRIIELLLVTTIPAMFLASGGWPSLQTVLVTFLGGLLAAGSANAFNCVLDRDIDEKMRRNRRCPMARHQVSPANAVIFAGILGIMSTLVLWFGANPLTALLAITANAFYVFIYTMWLKRSTSQNIVWGGIAGCFPPLIGWTAVTGRVSLAPLIMFAIVFFWTPPHTWALAFRYQDDYERAGIPMLPVVMGPRQVAVRILAYTVGTVAVSMALWPVAGTGPIYPIVAAIAGIAFIVEAVNLLLRANRGLTGPALKPMRLFHFSNSYLAIIFLAAAVDPIFFGTNPWF